ncbi:hypothetical protein NT6N_38360 [Oceaniferula spumae]|uniref:Uncharacterized protein n=1 Tax=Oceaniferula spumae TaxID=2979115 RepID=A0AAT9FS31_9BACT
MGKFGNPSLKVAKLKIPRHPHECVYNTTEISKWFYPAGNNRNDYNFINFDNLGVYCFNDVCEAGSPCGLCDDSGFHSQGIDFKFKC